MVPKHTGREAQTDRRRGFSMVELMIVVVVIVVAFLAMSQSLVMSMKLTGTNRETALATDGIRDQIEALEGVEDFTKVFALFNDNLLDDPPGVTAPGHNFAVRGLQPAPGDADGFVGEIIFPTLGFELREDVANPDLGMPRDLNGDGLVDTVNHGGDALRAADYKLLPVLLRVRWKGEGPERMTEVRTLLADR